MAKEMKDDLVIQAYIEGSLSLGEVAKIFGKNYIDMREWLQKRGIDPTGTMNDDIEAIQKKNVEIALNRNQSKALNALLNFKPLKGTNPKSTVEILREIRENE